MKCTEMLYALGVVVLALLLAGCSGGSSDGGVSAPEFAGPTVVAEETSEPTAVPTDVPAETPEPTAVPVSDEERRDAVLLALDEDGVNDELGLIAWDVLDWHVSGDRVDVSLCGWTGRSASDSIYESRWVVTGEAGALVAREEYTAFGSGECLNSELIDSAFEFIAEYEAYWTEMVRYPDRFEGDPRSERLQSETKLADAEAYLRRLAESGEYGDGLGLDGRPLETSVASPLYRRFEENGVRVLELAFCRPMDDGYGTYSSTGMLLDDDMVSDPGPHTVDAYVLQRSASGESWVYQASAALVWADCIKDGDWPGAANAWRPGRSNLSMLPGRP